MKKLLLLAVVAGFMSGCCGDFFKCTKDGKEASSCCGGHGHDKEAEKAHEQTDAVLEGSELLADAGEASAVEVPAV